ncbi:phosphotyrosine-specific ptp2-like protein, partial [Kickxella alabastrina]
LQYETWPDHGAPDTPLGVLRLRELACIAQGDDELAKNVPMVVHCSAGCGRTGAFCAIDTIMAMDPKEFVATPPVASAPPGMQMLPPGASYDPHGMYTGLVPQALRSKSSNASLAVEVEIAAEASSGSGSFNPRASRSLSRWNELPLGEFREDVVFIVVSRFRELRVSMVQTIQQFVFCHEALAWAALGAGPRPLSRVIDRRLVAEWNRANCPLLSEADCKDLTYQMRGRQEMLTAMLSADASSAGGGGGSSESNNSALVSGSGSGRASIDVSSGTMSAGSRPAGIVAPPLVKRSNSVGLARRGIFGAMFSPADVSDGGGTVSAGTKPTQQWNLAAPPVMKPAFSSDARLGIRNTPAAIAEEEEVLSAAADPVSAPMAERTAKPMFEAMAEQAIEPAAEPTVEPAAGPAVEPVMKPPQPKEVETAVASSTLSLSSSDLAVTKSPAMGLSSPDALKAQQQQQYQQYQQQLQTHQFHQLQEVQNQQQKTQQQGQKQRLAQRRPPGLSISISGATAAPLVSLATNSMPPPLLTNKLERPSPSGTNSGPVPVATDYFGCVREDSLSKTKNTPGNYSTDVMMDFDYCYTSGLGTAGGILDMFVGPPTSNAADWRRSVLGHLDASVEFSTAHGSVSVSNTAPGSPSTGAFVGNSALASPRVK